MRLTISHADPAMKPAPLAEGLLGSLTAAPNSQLAASSVLLAVRTARTRLTECKKPQDSDTPSMATNSPELKRAQQDPPFDGETLQVCRSPLGMISCVAEPAWLRLIPAATPDGPPKIRPSFRHRESSKEGLDAFLAAAEARYIRCLALVAHQPDDEESLPPSSCRIPLRIP